MKDQFYTPFYRNIIKWDRFPHFSDNRNETDKKDENYNHEKYEMSFKLCK
jgi:hypothetical protein